MYVLLLSTHNMSESSILHLKHIVAYHLRNYQNLGFTAPDLWSQFHPE